MTDNVAGQFGYGYNNQWIWLIWIAIIALVIFLFWSGGDFCCR